MYDLQKDYLLTFVVMIGCVLVTVYTVCGLPLERSGGFPGSSLKKYWMISAKSNTTILTSSGVRIEFSESNLKWFGGVC